MPVRSYDWLQRSDIVRRFVGLSEGAFTLTIWGAVGGVSLSPNIPLPIHGLVLPSKLRVRTRQW
jgi:hypothetical protein